MENYTIRKIQKKDIEIIKGLWKLHFGEAAAKKRYYSFNWITEGNPNCTTKDGYFVMEEDDKLIAYEGIMPYPLFLFDKDYDGFIYHDTMVDPSQRGKGIGTKLVKDVIQQNPQVSVAVWMNAPNARVFEKCGWKPVNKLFTFVRGYNAAPFIKTKWNIHNDMLVQIINSILAVLYKLEKVLYLFTDSRYSVTQINKFDDRVNDLFNSVKKEFRCIIFRTKDILNWKYSKINTPKYIKMICTSDDGLEGYIIFRTRKDKDGKTIATIFDYLCSPKKKKVFAALLEKAILEIEKDKPDSIEILCSNQKLNTVLKRYGFIKHTDNEFALKYINHKSIKKSERLAEGENWFFTHGDGDKVFWDL